MWFTFLNIIVIVCMVLILYDIHRLVDLQDELIKEHYILRGEVNALMGIQAPFMSNFNIFPEDLDKTTTVEITH